MTQLAPRVLRPAAFSAPEAPEPLQRCAASRLEREAGKDQKAVPGGGKKPGVGKWSVLVDGRNPLRTIEETQVVAGDIGVLRQQTNSSLWSRGWTKSVLHPRNTGSDDSTVNSKQKWSPIV